jgi:hypothetical protein
MCSSVLCLQARNSFWLYEEGCSGNEPCQLGIDRWALQRMSVSIIMDCCEGFQNSGCIETNPSTNPWSGNRIMFGPLIKLWHTLSICRVLLFQPSSQRRRSTHVDRGKVSCTSREGRPLLSQAQPVVAFVITVNSSFIVYAIFHFVTIWCTVAMKMIISIYVLCLLGVGF